MKLRGHYMVKIRFYVDRNTKAIKFNATGHAESNQYGNDIVCSAVSILAYTLAQNINDAYDRGYLKYSPVIIMQSGSATVNCKAKESRYSDIINIYRVIQTGYDLLEKKYSQYVDIIKFDEDV